MGGGNTCFMDKKIELLWAADWSHIYKNLVAKTEGRIDKFSWRTNTYPKGHTAESIVQDAIESVISHKSNWDPNRGTLEMYLWWVIKRNLNHLYNSKTYHPENIYEESLSPTEEEEWMVDRMEFKALASSRHSASSLYTYNDFDDREITDEESELKILALFESCESNPELTEIAYTIYEGRCSPKPAELAKYFGIPVSEVNARLRKLRYRANKIIEAFKE